jgi:hypothetical protein
MNPEPQQPPAGPDTAGPRAASFFEKLSAILFCIFCLEVGLFLLFYPWLDALWSRNWLLRINPQWHSLVMSEHFRGAVSGLGVLNLFIGVVEVTRLRRFSAR